MLIDGEPEERTGEWGRDYDLKHQAAIIYLQRRVLANVAQQTCLGKKLASF